MSFLGFVLGAAVIFTAAKLFKKPIEIIIKLLINSLVGFVVLILLNTLLASFGMAGIPVNIITSLITGIFGLPGIAALYLLSFIL